MRYFLLLLLVLLAPISWADKPPEWMEFCPYAQLDAQYGSVSKPMNPFLAITPIVNLAALPYGIKKRNRVKADEERNYWAIRRQEFETVIKACDTATDKDVCYMHIRATEKQKNENHRLEQEIAHLKRSQAVTQARVNQQRQQIYQLSH